MIFDDICDIIRDYVREIDVYKNIVPENANLETYNAAIVFGDNKSSISESCGGGIIVRNFEIFLYCNTYNDEDEISKKINSIIFLIKELVRVKNYIYSSNEPIWQFFGRMEDKNLKIYQIQFSYKYEKEL